MENLGQNSQMVHHGEVTVANSQEVVEKLYLLQKKKSIRKEEAIKGKWQDKCHCVFPLPGCLDTQNLGTRRVTVWVPRAQNSQVLGQR